MQWLDVDEPSGRQQGPEVFSHAAKPQLPCVLEKGSSLSGGVLVDQGDHWAPIVPGFRADHQTKAWKLVWPVLTERMKRKVFVMMGSTWEQLIGLKWSYLETQGSLRTLHILRMLHLKEICWDGSMGNRQYTSGCEDPSDIMSGPHALIWIPLQIYFPWASIGVTGPGCWPFRKLQLLWIGDKDGQRERSASQLPGTCPETPPLPLASTLTSIKAPSKQLPNEDSQNSIWILCIANAFRWCVTAEAFRFLKYKEFIEGLLAICSNSRCKLSNSE